jgi:hypothetical protein
MPLGAAYPLYLKIVLKSPSDYNPPKGGKLLVLDSTLIKLYLYINMIRNIWVSSCNSGLRGYTVCMKDASFGREKRKGK